MIFQTKKDFKTHLSQISQPYTLAALDVGTRYIGIATYNSAVQVVLPQKKFDLKKDSFKNILNYLEEKKVIGLIVGLPLLPNGEESEMSANVRKFINKILEHKDYDILFMDERFTSKQAHTLLRMHNIKRKTRDDLDDQISAQLILEQFIF